VAGFEDMPAAGRVCAPAGFEETGGVCEAAGFLAAFVAWDVPEAAAFRETADVPGTGATGLRTVTAESVLTLRTAAGAALGGAGFLGVLSDCALSDSEAITSSMNNIQVRNGL
jgi:hypothetical protein